jgi:hypothetical protein
VIRADEGVARAAMFGAMGGMFIAAITIPEAFDDLPSGLPGPAVFAACYFVVRAMHILMFRLAALAGDYVGTLVAGTNWRLNSAAHFAERRRTARADHHCGARRVDRLHRHRGGPPAGLLDDHRGVRARAHGDRCPVVGLLRHHLAHHRAGTHRRTRDTPDHARSQRLLVPATRPCAMPCSATRSGTTQRTDILTRTTDGSALGQLLVLRLQIL